jgi:choline kinase
MQNVNTAIICSAGRGSRLGHTIPKACVEVGGKSLIHWQLEALEEIRNVSVVVGYRKNYVIDEILTHRNNVTLIINNDWEKTNTAYSLSMGCELFDGLVLTIDGDTLFTKDDVRKMIRHKKAIGVTIPMSDEGVFVDVNENHEAFGFTRNRNTGLEWSGMSVMPSQTYLGRQNCFVYEIIDKTLPAKAQKIDLIEIDTPQDLERAREWVKKLRK